MRSVALVFVAVFVLILPGCAAGHGPNGEIVLGVKLGSLPETANEALGAAANVLGTAGALLPPPWGTVVTGVLGLFGAGAAAFAAKKSGDAKAADAATTGAVNTRAAADAAWDEAHSRATSAAQPAAPTIVVVPATTAGISSVPAGVLGGPAGVSSTAVKA